MIDFIVYVIIGMFLWSLSGILLGLLMLLGSDQREFVRKKLETNPRFMLDVFYGLSMLGPITYVIALVMFISETTKRFIGE